MTPQSPSGLLLSLALVFTLALPLRAQEPDPGVGAWVGPSLLVTRVSSQSSVLAGVEAGLVLRPSLRLGGGGYALLGEVELSRTGTTPLELSLGYGGVMVHYRLAETGGWALGAGVLAGGGAARIRDPVAGAELGSDNFVVVEPRVDADLALRPFMELSLSVRYRVPLGVDDLPGVNAADIRGFGGSVSLSLGSFSVH